jgi:hypothetical protein
MALPSLKLGGEHFGTAYGNERIVMVVHHHWWNLLKAVLGVVVLFFAPIIVIPVFGSFFGATANAAQLGAVVGFLGSLWALMCWHILFTRWTDFYFDIWVITNWRIIDMNLKGLFKIDIGSMLDLDHIQEITTHSDGVIENILGIGTIFVQTAATKHSEFEFNEVSNPQSVERVIRQAQIELHNTKAHVNDSPL